MLNSFSRKKETIIKIHKLNTVVEYGMKQANLNQLVDSFFNLKDLLMSNTEKEKQKKTGKQALLRFLAFKATKRLNRVVLSRYFFYWKEKDNQTKLLLKPMSFIINRLTNKQFFAFTVIQTYGKSFGSFIAFKKKLDLRLRRLQEKNRESMNIYTDENKVISKLIIRLESILCKKKLMFKEEVFNNLFYNVINNDNPDIEDIYINYKLLKKEKVI